jgi:hypothetical protein
MTGRGPESTRHATTRCGERWPFTDSAHLDRDANQVRRVRVASNAGRPGSVGSLSRRKRMGQPRSRRPGQRRIRSRGASAPPGDSTGAPARPDAVPCKKTVAIAAALQGLVDRAWYSGSFSPPGTSTPMRLNSSPCCARPASGRPAVAPPSSAMKSRRFN